MNQIGTAINKPNNFFYLVSSNTIMTEIFVLPAENELAHLTQVSGLPAPISLTFKDFDKDTHGEHTLDFWSHVKSLVHVDNECDYGVPFRVASKKQICFTNSDPDVQNVYLVQMVRDNCSSNAASDVVPLPGGSFGILPPQPSPLVIDLLTRLGISEPYRKIYLPPDIYKSTLNWSKSIPSMRVREAFLQGRASLSPFDLFTYALDIYSFPKKSLLCEIAKYCGDKREAKYLYYLSSKEGSDTYRSWMQQSMKRPTSLLDWLLCFSSCNPPIMLWIEHLPCIKPRYYSTTLPVQSEALGSIDLEFCFNVQPSGLCSKWLETLVSPIYCIPNRSMSGIHCINTDHLSKPWIMVATGTGIAPMVSMIRERLSRAATPTQPSIWLIYGCRYRGIDSLFHDELMGLGFREDSTSNMILDLVTSRDSSLPSKRYVHHVFTEKRDRAIQWLFDRDATIFVCGNRTAMAQDMHATLLSLVRSRVQETVDSTTRKDPAQELLLEWSKCGKYQREVWSG
jgi:sulfite reductase alpha subunit-like flavoprotein